MFEYTRAGITFLTFNLLAEEKGTLHAITTRTGGVSTPPFNSLNFGGNVGDVEERVIRNYQLLSRALGLEMESFMTSKQVHGDRVIEITKKDEANGPFSHEREEGDAMVTNITGPVLMVRVADCIPLLFFDPVQRVIGIVHAGWRGTVKKISAKTVEVFTGRYSSNLSDILVGIGPGVGPCCYEVGGEVSALYEAGFPSKKDLLETRQGRRYLNLWEANRSQLLDTGIPGEHIEMASLCTSCHPQTFFSHRGEKGRTGRFAALIGLKG